MVYPRRILRGRGSGKQPRAPGGRDDSDERPRPRPRPLEFFIYTASGAFGKRARCSCDYARTPETSAFPRAVIAVIIVVVVVIIVMIVINATGTRVGSRNDRIRVVYSARIVFLAGALSEVFRRVIFLSFFFFPSAPPSLFFR